MKTAFIFVLAILCDLTFCAKKQDHFDYKTIDVAYPLRHKQYFDLKYKTSGVADPWRHEKYIDLEDRSSDVADPWRNKKYIALEHRATRVADPVSHCKSLTQTYNIKKNICFLKVQKNIEKAELNENFIINFE